VRDGEEALNFIANFKLDLVITDILMPGMDGLKLAQEIRDRGYNTEIVMISGYSDHSYYRQALQNGAADYLMKPIDADEVIKTMTLIADKLRKQQRELCERSEWVSICKPSIHRLANFIWIMNNEAVAKELAIIHEYFSSNRFKGMQSNERSILLLTLLNAELIEISGDRIHLERFAEFQTACFTERSCEMVLSLIRKAMEEIRQLRNWGTHRIILKALELIHQSYMEKSLTLQVVAMCVGISPNYFSKCFREEVGVSFSLYLARLRMNKAIDLLNDPLFKVYEVAHASGFSDYAHFAKVFKKNFEFSPTEYRVNVGII
jgi:two-component system response regulator YesN